MSESPKQRSRQHVFGFMDETGLLHTPATDRMFALGLLVLPNPRYMHKAIVNYKNKQNYHEEFKFTDVRRDNLSLYKGLVDIFFKSQHTRFHSVVYNKEHIDLKKYFNGNHEKAYNSFSARLISNSIDKSRGDHSEYITILADDVSTTINDKFEQDIRDHVKSRLRRNALFGMCRLESHAVSEIQLCDVMVGSVAYAFKVKLGLIPKPSRAKINLLKHIQKHLGVARIDHDLNRQLKHGVLFNVEEYKFK